MELLSLINLSTLEYFNLIDHQRRAIVDLDKKLSNSNDETQLNNRKLSLNRGYLTYEKVNFLELNPFTGRIANSGEWIHDKLKIEIVSRGNLTHNIYHYYPFMSKVPKDRDIIEYIELIKNFTPTCLRYDITKSSIIAYSEVDSVTKFNNGYVHPAIEFHLDFFASYGGIVLSFESDRFINTNSITIFDKNQEELDYGSKRIHTDQPIVSSIDLFDDELYNMINKFTQTELDNLNSSYEDYLSNYRYNSKIEIDEEKFEFTPYIRTLLGLLSTSPANKSTISDPIEHLKLITHKLKLLRNRLSFSYKFKSRYYDNGRILKLYERNLPNKQ